MKNILLKKAEKDIIEWQIKVFACLPKQFYPNIYHITKYSYRYDFIDGNHNLTSTDLRTVYNLCKLYFWYPKVYTEQEKKQQIKDYLIYCYEKITGVELSFLRSMIKTNYLSFTNIIHGDLTIENIIKTNDKKIIFIDPSPPHFLCCKELDESKLLQSILTGWEVIKRKWEFILIDPPFEIRPVHIGLLLTHWIRLYAHKDFHKIEIIKKAEKTIEGLIQLCKELKNDNNNIGYRWCFNRLKEFNIPGLQKSI